MTAIFNVPKIFEKISIVAMRWLAPGAGFGIMSGRRHRNFPASPSIAGDGVVRKYETGLKPLDARCGAASDVARIRLLLIGGVRRGPCQAHYHRLTQAGASAGVSWRTAKRDDGLSRSDFTPARHLVAAPSGRFRTGCLVHKAKPLHPAGGSAGGFIRWCFLLSRR
jgi:hypothetical protein